MEPLPNFATLEEAALVGAAIQQPAADGASVDEPVRYYVNIVVHRGSLHDTSNERRVGLWFVPTDEGAKFYFHVKGVQDRYQFEVKENWDPTCTASALPLVFAGKTEPISGTSLVKLLQDVPIESEDLEFNSHQWIYSALDSLHRHCHLTKAQRDQSFNLMIELVLEGSSDELHDSDRHSWESDHRSWDTGHRGWKPDYRS
ncbi:hypothetical protein QQS21_012346 [Conoideocrella luteorostrata]|uniref:Uncharacterized protein n=1 Tax=Conoideocrella luteorostrata TaxID=1105319 RepID=A0AAJ0CBC7_9HYPO|nr:hypothetical protein QQS21_012346 [Conoideocrella luteorostrata]